MKRKQIVRVTKEDLKNMVKNAFQEITQEKLNEEINDCINRCSATNIKQTILTEMALHKSDYKKRAESILIQIMQNWCLIMYYRLSNDDSIATRRNHWGTELIAHINNLASLEIKQHIGKINAKISTLMEVINDRDFDSNPNAINLMISQKFVEENINFENNQFYYESIQKWLESYKTIVLLIAQGNVMEIRNYVIRL